LKHGETQLVKPWKAKPWMWKTIVPPCELSGSESSLKKNHCNQADQFLRARCLLQKGRPEFYSTKFLHAQWNWMQLGTWLKCKTMSSNPSMKNWMHTNYSSVIITDKRVLVPIIQATKKAEKPAQANSLQDPISKILNIQQIWYIVRIFINTLVCPHPVQQ
jgi:hypothetical protein